MCKVVLNQEKNGIEMYFNDKPSETIRTEMKENGFRWFFKKECWIAKQSEKTLKLANKYSDSEVETKVSAIKETKQIKSKKLINLWDACQYIEVKREKIPCKEIAKQVRKELKSRFSFCKFSVTSDYNSIWCEIKSTPFSENSECLKAIKNYCDKLIESYNYCTCYDPYGDYGSSYHFYFHNTTIDYDYKQTEITAELQEAIKEFDIKKAEFDKAEEERKEREYQEREAKREAEHQAYLLRMEEEKKEIEYINNNVEVKKISENNQYFVKGSEFANLNKNATLEQYKEEVKKGDYSLEDIKITREVYFQDVESLEYFSNLLLNDFDFINGTGGSNTDDLRINSMEDYDNMTDEERETVKWYLKGVAVYFNDKLQFVIDAQGCGYARYVGLVDNATIEKKIEYKQVMSDSEVEELKEQVNILENISYDVITDNDIIFSWDKDCWRTYKNAIKKKILDTGFNFNKSIVQQIEDDKLKIAMYRLLKEVDEVQEQFNNSNLVQGDKLTIIKSSMLCGVSVSHITLDSFTNEEYAQYKDCTKMIFKVNNKRGLYQQYIYDDVLIYKGWINFPENLMFNIEDKNGFISKESKYGSYDNRAYDDVIEYFKQQGVKPIINTYKPVF
ncbi:LPD29 domain-containing protein [Clostridium sp. ZBS18]|uniref:LPD29 domain-containing protein n=1 Tax=Clostridium sp. ZBS18 TaxID=2949967 RepID=UPI002079AC64|nr:LPD29 domain-containing protein [Clostridium sp. ZBS18]